jgi:prefoldin alpha subunit
MEKAQQELMMKFQMFEQQAQQLQQQLQAVTEGVVELGQLNLGLDDLKGGKGKEIMAPYGRGIFVKAKLLEEELTVDIGNKNFVKKNVDETKKTIQDQIKKLEEMKAQLEGSLEKLGAEMQTMIMEVQAKEEKKAKKK